MFSKLEKKWFCLFLWGALTVVHAESIQSSRVMVNLNQDKLAPVLEYFTRLIDAKEILWDDQHPDLQKIDFNQVLREENQIAAYSLAGIPDRGYFNRKSALAAERQLFDFPYELQYLRRLPLPDVRDNEGYFVTTPIDYLRLFQSVSKLRFLFVYKILTAIRDENWCRAGFLLENWVALTDYFNPFMPDPEGLIAHLIRQQKGPSWFHNRLLDLRQRIISARILYRQNIQQAQRTEALPAGLTK